jgi:hypothetical protein
MKRINPGLENCINTCGVTENNKKEGQTFKLINPENSVFSHSDSPLITVGLSIQ